MSIKADEVEAIAHLARIRIDARDIPDYASALGSILALVDQLNRANTTGVEPMANPHDLRASLRPDEVTETDQWSAFESIAPATESGVFLVPRVIE
jgi:aspartyl-tRNA(Asn)/glutamyl-tRNA(Gln) amidotransferase subunit C